MGGVYCDIKHQLYTFSETLVCYTETQSRHEALGDLRVELEIVL